MLKRILCSVLLTTCLAAAQPSGDFWVGESEGDDFNTKLHLEEGKATMQLLSESGDALSTQNLSVKEIDKDLYHLQGGDIDAYLKWRGNGEALMWYSGSSMLYWCVQADSRDVSPLEGDWKALAGHQIMAASFADSTLNLKKGSGDEAAWKLYPVVSQGDEYRMVSRTRSGQSFLLYFVSIQPNMWLLRNHEEDNVVFLFRGDVQDWMSKELQKRKAGANVGSPRPSPSR